MIPSASKRWIRFQHGVAKSPTSFPISATDRDASCWSSASIVRSVVFLAEYSGFRGRAERGVRSSLAASEDVHRTGDTLAYSISSFARDLGVMRGRGMP